MAPTARAADSIRASVEKGRFGSANALKGLSSASSCQDERTRGYAADRPSNRGFAIHESQAPSDGGQQPSAGRNLSSVGRVASGASCASQTRKGRATNPPARSEVIQAQLTGLFLTILYRDTQKWHRFSMGRGSRHISALRPWREAIKYRVLPMKLTVLIPALRSHFTHTPVSGGLPPFLRPYCSLPLAAEN